MSKKYKVINIRGCNGSGKSFIVRKLMKESKAEPIYDTLDTTRLLGSIIGYEGIYEGEPIFFVGSYAMMSGGADYISKHFGIDRVEDLVCEFSTKGNVIFEGFIISGLFQRYYDLSKKVGGIIFCFLDTPLEVCLERINARNKSRTPTGGRVRKSMGIKTIKDKHYQVGMALKKFKSVNENVVIIDHKKPMSAIRKILKG